MPLRRGHTLSGKSGLRRSPTYRSGHLSDDAEIITLHPPKGGPEERAARSLVKRSAPQPCRHHVHYSVEENRAWCTMCGRDMLPIDALDYVAREWEMRLAPLERRQTLEEQLEDLYDEERRTKARLARARKGLTETQEADRVAALEDENAMLRRQNASLRSTIRRMRP